MNIVIQVQHVLRVSLFFTMVAMNAAEHVLGITVGRVDTKIGLFKAEGGNLSLLDEGVLETSGIPDFTAFLQQLLTELENQKIHISRACIAAPGVSSEKYDFMHPYYIPFVLSAQELKEQTSLKHVKIINDFEVLGFGLDYLDENSVITLYQGKQRMHAPRAIIGVGNGVGSSLVTVDQNYKICSYPLGYCYADFASQNEQELSIVNYIKHSVNTQHMSWGYALGGSAGLRKLYDYFAQEMNISDGCTAMSVQDIIESALTDPIAEQAVTLYMTWYIRLLRTAALTQLPYGGLYITNSIADNNRELFTSPEFLEEYLHCNHPILRGVLEEIPLLLITEPKIQLFAAAACALSA